MLKSKHDYILPLLVFAVALFIVLSIISGYDSFSHFRRQFEISTRQHNSALVNHMDEWINGTATIVENNSILLRNPNFTPEMVFDYFVKIIDINNSFSCIVAGRADGSAVSASMGIDGCMPEGYCLHEMPWYIKASDAPGDVVYVSPYFNVVVEEIVFSVARTIDNYSDDLGATAIHIPFFPFIEQIREVADFLYGGFSFILDENGYVLLHRDPVFEPDENHAFLNMNTFEGGKHAEMVATVKRGETYRGGGHIYLGASLGTTGWYTVTRVPVDQVRQEGFRTLRSISATVLVAIISLFAIKAIRNKIIATVANEREAKEETRQAEERAMIMFDSAPIAITVYDSDFNSVDGNREALKMYGLSEDNKSYLPLEDIFNTMPPAQPDGRDSREVLKELLILARDEGFSQSEILCRKTDGTIFPANVTWVRIKHKNDIVIVEYAMDMTETRAAMESEQESIALTSKLLDNSPQFVEFWDIDGNLFDVNEKLLNAVGVKSKTEFAERFYELSAEIQPGGMTGRELNEIMIKNAVRYGAMRSEWSYLLPNGDILPADTTWVHIMHKGTPMVVVYSHDLRPIKAAMEREREAIENQRVMYDATPIPTSVWTEDMLPINCNSATVEFLGASDRGDFLNNFLDFYPELQPCGTSTADMMMQFRRRLPEEKFLRTPWTLKHKSGELISGEMIIVQVEYDGKPMAVTYVYDLRPINEAKARENELLLQLQAREMNERVKIAEEASKTKSRFLASMSHEIRTPITAVLGISEIELQSPNLSPQMQSSLSKIHSSATMLLAIVNDVLDLSKIEAGKTELQYEEYDVANMISEITALHPNYLTGKNIAFHLHASDNLPTHLIGDSLRIEQVISNLLSNAFKYTEQGRVELSWACRPENDGIVTLVISITDTGRGMTAEQLELLRNNEYVRFHEHENRHINGTGLGMPIVFSLLELMNAKISIESEPGTGTKVVINIPQESQKAEIIGPEIVERLQRFDKTMLKKFTLVPESMPYGNVLVVDDVDANIYVAKGLLALYDLNVDTCSGGHQAIEKIKQGNKYDIIFMDYMMPGINGIETLNILRETGYTRPVVALTANALIGQEEEFLKCGFNAFISKPIQTKRLNAVLNTFIRDKYPVEVVAAARAAKKNTAVDIENFHNNADMVNKLRIEFVRSHKNDFAEFSRFLNAGDTDAAHLVVHSLKGVAMLIHEPALSQAAAAAEQSLRNGEKPSDEQLLAIETELTRVINAIGKIDAPSAISEFDPEKARDIFEKLLPLVENHDAAILDLLDELKKVPETAVLVRQIEEFSFSDAAVTLATLKDVYEIN
ncbi:MAG: ATP-binding protein [Defluviitaleaceae bacterium]|nr:ATP-binding protein [Defluviitaleaceae bacterium]